MIPEEVNMSPITSRHRPSGHVLNRVVRPRADPKVPNLIAPMSRCAPGGPAPASQRSAAASATQPPRVGTPFIIEAAAKADPAQRAEVVDLRRKLDGLKGQIQ